MRGSASERAALMNVSLYRRDDMGIMGLGLIFAMAAPVCLIVAGGCALFLSRKAFSWWRGFLLCILAVILCAVISTCTDTEPVEIPDSIKPQFMDALAKSGLPLTVEDVTSWERIDDYAFGERYKVKLYNKKPGGRYTLLVYAHGSDIQTIYDITSTREIVYGDYEDLDAEITEAKEPAVVDLSIPYEQIYCDFNKNYSEAEALYCGNRYRVKAKVELLPEDGMTVTFAQWIGGTEKVTLTGEFWETRADDLEKITLGSVVTFTGVCTGQTSFEDCELITG